MNEKRRYKQYKKFDVIYVDFGNNQPGVQSGVRAGIIVSCNASNHAGAPQVTVVPLTSKLKDIPVHVRIHPNDVSGYPLKVVSDFIPEDIQTLAKSCIRAKTGYIPEESEMREQIDRALIRQLDLLPVATKMVKEEMQGGESLQEDKPKKVC